MHFTDASGRKWHMRIDWAAMRRSGAAGVDLSMVEQYLGDFHRGSVKLIDALWAVCKPQAEEDAITREAFEAQIKGETIDTSREALLAGLDDFFPIHRGKVMRAAAEEVDVEIRDLLSQSQKRSTALRGSSASIPTPSPSENSAGSNTVANAPNGIASQP